MKPPFYYRPSVEIYRHMKKVRGNLSSYYMYIPNPHPTIQTSNPNNKMAHNQKKSSNLLDSPTSKLTPLEKSELHLADNYSSPDVYINGEHDTLWHPWVNNLEIKPLRFETRTGTFVIVLRAKEDTWLGKHRHRGSVTAVTLKGEWNYKEYSFPFLI